MFPRMYSSVKFFEPTVSWIPLLAEFDLIRLAELFPLVPVSLLSLLPPQAATPRASSAAAISAKAALFRGACCTPWNGLEDPKALSRQGRAPGAVQGQAGRRLPTIR